MAWYIVGTLDPKKRLVSMAIGGPYQTKGEAMEEILKNPVLGPLIPTVRVGPDDLGPDWESNRARWLAGEYEQE